MRLCVPTEAGGKINKLQHQFATNHQLWVRLLQKKEQAVYLPGIFNFTL